jgi:hypothetical protein
MNAAASSLIEAIKYSFNPSDPSNTGTDWDSIPCGATSWFKYGSGGVSSWGSLCGVPNGCVAVLNLMNIHSTYADKVMYYACQTEFPIKGLHDLWVADGGTGWSKEPVPDGEVLAYVIPGSPLCHVSVSKWADEAGVSLTTATSYSTAHKTDRCAKVAAGIAAFTAELINGVTSSLTMPSATAACITCHSTSTVPAQQGKMDCATCHDNLRPHIEGTDNPPSAHYDNLAQTGLGVSFDDISDDNNTRPRTSLTITVNWGDGKVSSGKGGDPFSHTYKSAGKYIVLHTAKDQGNLYASEAFDVKVPEENAQDKYSITVNVVEDDDSTPVVGATIYLKQKKVGGRWKQIMYGYTDADGEKVFENLLAGDTEYIVAVYKSSMDFYGNKKGKQSKVKMNLSDAFKLECDRTVTLTQGDEADNGPTSKPWKGNNGSAPTIDVSSCP